MKGLIFTSKCRLCLYCVEFITVGNITVGLYRIQSLVLGDVSITANILYALVEILNLAKKERNTYLPFFAVVESVLLAEKYIHIYVAASPRSGRLGKNFTTKHLTCSIFSRFFRLSVKLFIFCSLFGSIVRIFNTISH